MHQLHLSMYQREHIKSVDSGHIQLSSDSNRNSAKFTRNYHKCPKNMKQVSLQAYFICLSRKMSWKIFQEIKPEIVNQFLKGHFMELLNGL